MPRNLAGCSLDFFQKVFSYMNGISFAEYVRSRKLTLAGYDLKSTDLRIVDISYKYGYNSPTSFTKVFQQFHGVSPKEARKKNIELAVMPKMQMMSKQKYSIMAISDVNLPDGFTEVVLPETTWAIFDCVGMIPQSIHNGWKYLNEEWLIKYRLSTHLVQN